MSNAGHLFPSSILARIPLRICASQRIGRIRVSK